MAQTTEKDHQKGAFLNHFISIEGCYLPPDYEYYAESIKNFEVFDSDIWIISYPRTGTTWSSEMAWLIANDCDLEKAKESMHDRIRFMELGVLFHSSPHPEKNSFPALGDSVNHAKNQPHPRVIKTHLPFPLLPDEIRSGQKKPRMIYICRNPLDICVSYYHHLASIAFHGDKKEFYEMFLDGKVLYGSYWDHVLPFWKIRDQPNLLFLKYEEMKADLPKVIRKTATFLGKNLSDAQVESAQKHLSLDSMKNNESICGGKILEIIKSGGAIYSPFVRSGKVGGYKDEMTEDYIVKFKKWMNENTAGTGLNF